MKIVKNLIETKVEALGLINRVFANGLGDRGSIPGG